MCRWWKAKISSASTGLVSADENLHVVGVLAAKRTSTFLTLPSAAQRQETSWAGSTWQSKPESKVYEYACHEGNYAMGNILRGARLLEKQWQPAADTADGAEVRIK